MSYKVQATGLTDIGLVRQNNEDAWGQIPNKRFYILADGMGGHQAGEVASHEAVAKLSGIIEQEVDHCVDPDSIEAARQLICEAIEETNRHVFAMGRNAPELRGMGTTLCCLFFHTKGLVYAHVGDSRIYRLRDKKLHLMTKDHSLLRELIDKGQVHRKHREEHSYKNIITKAIGTEAQVDPSVRYTDVLDKDIYIMCSDGLSDLLTLEMMEAILNKRSSVKEMAEHLVDAAKQLGGYDNITVVIAKVQEAHEYKKDLPR